MVAKAQMLKMRREMVDHQVEAQTVGMQLRLPAADPARMLHLYKPMMFERTKCGGFEILSETQQCFDATSFRHMALLGVRKLRVDYGSPVTFHKLVRSERSGTDGSGCLTSDEPVEVYSQYIAFHKMHGHVLVAGLGLGMAAQMILALPRVKSVTVVEKERDIIKLMSGQLDSRLGIIHDDIYAYLNTTAMKYDSAYFDVWYETGESTWVEHVVPLYRLARQAGIKTLGAWGEHEMVAQTASQLFLRSGVKEMENDWKPYQVFVQGLKAALGGKPPYGKASKARVVNVIKCYLFQIGTPKWEKLFGVEWDHDGAS